MSMREDGCVVACCVHLFWYWAARMGAAWSARGLLRMCLIAAGWFLVFAAGMWFLAYKNDFQQTRAGEAFGRLRELPWAQARAWLQTVAVEALAMLAPLSLFPLLFFRLRYVVAMIVLTAPLLAVGLVASLVYATGSDGAWFALTWNPRFAMVVGSQPTAAAVARSATRRGEEMFFIRVVRGEPNQRG